MRTDRMTEQEEMFAIMDGMEEVNRAMHQEELRVAPLCHMRPMFRDMSDSTDGYCEEWWECSVCGHTKPLYRRRGDGEISIKEVTK